MPLTGDTGAFWFFDPANLELMIKVLDGRAVNGYFWVFYGSLSNVEFTVTVTDTTTGAVKTYHNAPLQFASQADVDGLPRRRRPRAPRAAARRRRPRRRSGLLRGGRLRARRRPASARDRFRVAVSFTDPRTGTPAPAHGRALTGDTGIFWFFDPRTSS